MVPASQRYAHSCYSVRTNIDPIQLGDPSASTGQVIDVLPEKDAVLGEPLYTQLHQIQPNKVSITMAVPHAPACAGVDLRHLLIELELGDNIKTVKHRN